jgi:hypothetical protein
VRLLQAAIAAVQAQIAAIQNERQQAKAHASDSKAQDAAKKTNAGKAGSTALGSQVNTYA